LILLLEAVAAAAVEDRLAGQLELAAQVEQVAAVEEAGILLMLLL